MVLVGRWEPMVLVDRWEPMVLVDRLALAVLVDRLAPAVRRARAGRGSARQARQVLAVPEMGREPVGPVLTCDVSLWLAAPPILGRFPVGIQTGVGMVQTRRPRS